MTRIERIGDATLYLGAQPFLPLSSSSPWIGVKDGDDGARALFHRHYSYRPYADGRAPSLFVGPGEKLVLMTVFIVGPKSGSDMAFVLADASVLISIALQSGIPAADLARSMSRIPLNPDDLPAIPASPIGAAVDLLTRIEAEGI